MRCIFILLLASLMTVLALNGCSDSRKQIVGKWKAEGSETVWEFFANGTLDTSGTPGRYTFGDSNRLKIQTGAATFVYQLELQGERMILKDPSGSKLELEKIK